MSKKNKKKNNKNNNNRLPVNDNSPPDESKPTEPAPEKAVKLDENETTTPVWKASRL